jgi:hypothetical protein
MKECLILLNYGPCPVISYISKMLIRRMNLVEFIAFDIICRKASNLGFFCATSIFDIEFPQSNFLRRMVASLSNLILNLEKSVMDPNWICSTVLKSWEKFRFSISLKNEVWRFTWCSFWRHM